MEKERAERIKNYNRQRDAKDYFTEITWDENVPQGKELEARDSESFVQLVKALRELARRWNEERAHTYASENAEHYRGFDTGRQRSAEELLWVVNAHENETIRH
jgi:hypothetical protein